MKISILGVAGSGKSTLAKKLVQKYDMTHMDLDYVVFKPIKGTHKRLEPTEDEYINEIEKFMEKSNWIIEGFCTFEIILNKADKIIFLDTPLIVSLYRQWKRFVTDHPRRKQYGFIKGLKLTRNTIQQHFGTDGRYIHQSVKLMTVAEMKELLKKYKEKVIILNNNHEVDDFIKNYSHINI